MQTPSNANALAKKKKSFWFLASAALMLVTISDGLSPVQAIVIANFATTSNDRFANSGSFIGNSYDFSGVGRTAGGRWATRIGSNYFISADHFHPLVGDNVTFYSTNNPVGASFSYSVAGGFQVTGTDLWIGYFNSSMDSSIETYSYTTIPANSVNDTGLVGSTLFMMGSSITADRTYGGGVRTDIAVGQNGAESWFEEGTTTVLAAGVNNVFGSPAAWDQIVLFENQSVDDGAFTAETHESQLQSGDSGSPLFSTSGGELIIQGIAWAVSTLQGNFDFLPINADLESRNATFYTYTGSYSTDISSTIAMIPEPSSFALLAIGFGVGLALWRRNRQS